MSDADEHEEGSLIPQAEVTQENSTSAAFPVAYFFLAVLSVLAPLAVACSTLLLPCAPSLSQLPLKLPFFSQVGYI